MGVPVAQAAPWLMVGGSALQASAMLERGNAAKLAADRRYEESRFEAQQLETNAGQARAAGQRGAADEVRRAAFAASRALAVAAASGASASDPSVVKTISDIKAEGSYRSMLDLYAGEERARAMENQATATRYAGETAVSDAQRARRVSQYGAGATLLSGFGQASLYQKYGGGGPPGSRSRAGDLDAGNDFSDTRLT